MLTLAQASKNRKNKTDYIYAFFKQGNDKGVLEITYDGTTLSNLQDEQRLLDWKD